MRRDKPHGSVTVNTGILTPEQFAELPPDDRVRVEADTVRLLQKHGRAWLDHEKDRLREEIAFAYGV